MKDPKLSILKLLKKNWSLTGELSAEKIVWAVAPFNDALGTPQICLTDADVDHKLLASRLYKVDHRVKVGVYVSGSGTKAQKQKYALKEEVRRVLAAHPGPIDDVDYLTLGEDWRDADDLEVKPPLLGAEGAVVAHYFIREL